MKFIEQIGVSLDKMVSSYVFSSILKSSGAAPVNVKRLISLPFSRSTIWIR